jgi:hypothetical protein
MPKLDAAESKDADKKEPTSGKNRTEKLQEEEVRQEQKSQDNYSYSGDASRDGAAVVGLPKVELCDDSSKFKEMVQKSQSKIDTDNDGIFSDKEITTAMNNSDLKGTDAQVAATLKRLKDTLSGMKSDGGLTMADIDKTQEFIDQSKSGKGTTESDKVANSVLGTLQQTKISLDAADNCDYQLFNTENPLDSITPQAAEQGTIGNCYFIASLSSMAATQDGKEAIQKMIKDNRDGTYTVTFPGAPDEPITVTRPTDSQLATYAKADNNGIWAAVLEKAFGQYSSESMFRRSIFNPIESDIPQENSDGGALTDDALELLTGKRTESVDMSNQARTEEELKQALSSGESVTLGRHGSIAEFVGISDEDKEIPHGHKYSIIGYDAETKMVTVRNPWGHGEPLDENGQPKDGKDDGIYQMPIADLPKFYDNMSVTKTLVSAVR